MNQEEKLVALRKITDESVLLRRALIEQLGPKLLEFADVMSGVVGSGGKILIGGNGGSLALASHFASELVVRLTGQRNRQALPAITLGLNSAMSSAAADEFGWENTLARQIEALGARRDLLILLSVSGNSANLLKAARTAREMGILTAALAGGSGGKLRELVDRALVVPHNSAQRVHEEHLYLVHLLAALVERDLIA